jgi:phosphohistidine phosphatase
MDLYIIRHAEAVPHGTPGIEDDGLRPLTDAGREHSRQLGELFRRLDIRLDVVVTSPLVRARETTDGFVTHFGEPRPEIEVHDELGGDFRRKRLARFLAMLGKPSVAVVGHQPTLGGFLAWLIGSKRAQVQLEKAGFAWVTCESPGKGGGILQWLITPDWFAAGDGAKS